MPETGDRPKALAASDYFTKRRISLLVSIATGLAAILTVMNQAQIAEPHWLATRSFVRDYISSTQKNLETRQIKTQLYLATTERSRLENEIANKQLLITQNPTMPETVKQIILEQIRTLNISLENNKLTTDDLRREIRSHGELP